MEHAGEHHVVEVIALAADEAVVLDPAAARAHPADLDLVEGTVSFSGPLGCLSHGVTSSLSAGAWSRIFAAAQSTALTMFW